MQAPAQKKKSLFSQRIKQTKNQQPYPSDHSFPKAVKIPLQPLQQHIESEKKNIGGKSFVKKILQKGLKGDQLEQIQKENEKSIMSMSQQEIKKYQELILKQMPPAFTKKIQEQFSSSKIIHQEQKQEGKQQANIQQQQQQGIAQQSQSVLAIQEQEQMQNICSLCINIKEMKVHVVVEGLNTNNSDFVTVQSLKLMITSENNQTQIVGSKIAVTFCENLFLYGKVNQHLPLTKIQGHYWHLTKLSSQIFQHIVTSLIKQIKRTKFKSCWVELILALIQIWRIICLELSKVDNGKLNQLISTFLESQFKKGLQFGFEQLKIDEKANKKTGFCLNDLKDYVNEINEQVKNMNKNINYLEIAHERPDLLVELIQLQIVELSLKNSKFQTFIEAITKYCQSNFQNSKQNKLRYLTQLFYPLALDLKVKDLKSNGLSNDYQFVKQALCAWLLLNLNEDHILPSTSIISSFKDKREQQQTFKALVITQVLSLDLYSKLLSSLNSGMGGQSMHIQISNENLANILTYLSIKQYFSTTCEVSSMQEKSYEIENVQKMFEFLKMKLEDGQQNYIKNIGDFVVNDMLCIFSNYLQPQKQNEGKVIRLTYNDINEELLNSTISLLCELVINKNFVYKLWVMISEQKVKTLIESYNYDSFGNYIFTKLLLFLIACCPIKQFQSLVIEEVIARYPFLFYYAAQKGLYGPNQIYLNGQSLQEMQVIIGMLDTGNKTRDPSNMLRRFLLKQ